MRSLLCCYYKPLQHHWAIFPFSAHHFQDIHPTNTTRCACLYIYCVLMFVSTHTMYVDVWMYVCGLLWTYHRRSEIVYMCFIYPYNVCRRECLCGLLSAYHRRSESRASLASLGSIDTVEGLSLAFAQTIAVGEEALESEQWPEGIGVQALTRAVVALVYGPRSEAFCCGWLSLFCPVE